MGDIKKTVTRLFDQEYDEVSFVDSGANGAADVVIFKRDPEAVAKGDPTGADLHIDAPLGGDKKHDPDNCMVVDCPLCKKLKVRKSPEEDPVDTIDKTHSGEDDMSNDAAAPVISEEVLKSLPAEVQDWIMKADQYMADLEDQIPDDAEIEKMFEAADQPDQTDEEESEVSKFDEDADFDTILKSADPAVQAIVAKLQADADEAIQIAKAERDARVTSQYVEKATQNFPHLNADPEELGRVIKSLDEWDEDVAKYVTDLLTAANAQVSEFTSGSTRIGVEIGKGYSDMGTDGSAAEAQAQEIAKVEGISIEQARVKVFEQNSELYDRMGK